MTSLLKKIERSKAARKLFGGKKKAAKKKPRSNGSQQPAGMVAVYLPKSKLPRLTNTVEQVMFQMLGSAMDPSENARARKRDADELELILDAMRRAQGR